MEAAAAKAFRHGFPQGVQWTEFQPYVALRSVSVRLLPSCWRVWRLLRQAQDLLGPRIREPLDADERRPEDDGPEQARVLRWLCRAARARDGRPDTMAHLLVLAALATVHTTLLRVVNALYDVVEAGPGPRGYPAALRFSASLVIKMVAVKALAGYDFEFEPGAGQPRNLVLHEFLFPWPSAKMMVRRKAKGSCPI
ncbi:hypothetical protein CDD83_6843 [Cordyceps sp. RAO-2017]|nr:hypothetical protein CDD83_6843 [Cordyceps sp. RAO-2017]